MFVLSLSGPDIERVDFSEEVQRNKKNGYFPTRIRLIAPNSRHYCFDFYIIRKNSAGKQVAGYEIVFFNLFVCLA
jgi:hypothetical protein